MNIRISYGTAVKMGLKKAYMSADPTTAYIMVGNNCSSNCSFCAQRRDNKKEGYLSRVLWIPYDVSVLRDMKGFARICFQTLDYERVVEDLLNIIDMLPPSVPISVSIVPISLSDMKKLRDAGVEIISIALDAANPEIFRRVKGYDVGNRFTWEKHWKYLIVAKEVFKNVNTHIIVGLGESDKDIYSTMKKLHDLDISVALFAYTPVFEGAAPPVGRYRAAQLMRYLMSKGYRNFANFEDDRLKSISIPEKEMKAIERGIPFMTSGCPGCNRPFYNERPGGVMYNYPYLPDIHAAKKTISELKSYVSLESYD